MICEVCDFSYLEGPDRAEHRKFHQKWLDAKRLFSYEPMTGEGQEAQKIQGAQLRDGLGLELDQRVYGALLVLDAHFERSLRASVLGGKYQKHPALGAYVAMRLRHSEYPAEIQHELVLRYGTMPGIEAGSSYFETVRRRPLKRRKNR